MRRNSNRYPINNIRDGGPSISARGREKQMQIRKFGPQVRSRWHRFTPLGLIVGLILPTGALAAPDLSSFAILSGSTITNTGTTTISGSIGLDPGTAFTGQGPGADEILQSNGSIYIANGVASQAKNDLTSAFNLLMGRPASALSGDLGGMTLFAGAYAFSSSAQLTGVLTLSGNSNDIFIIKVGSSLTTASASSVVLSGTVDARNVFFVVGESATLGTGSALKGQILAGTSISLGTSASVDCGAVYAQIGAVTLQSNTIRICTFVVAPGEIADILDDDITSNGGSIADAIDAYITSGGTLPLSYQLLSLLSPTELGAALDHLSGEVGTGAAPASFAGTNSLLDLVTTGTAGPRVLVSRPLDAPQSGQSVSVMGYSAPSPTVADPFGPSSLQGPTFGLALEPEPAPWTAWLAGLGSVTHIEGDGAIGSHHLDINTAAIAIGIERHFGSDASLGLAVSTGATQFSLSDALGSGTDTPYQVMLYGRADSDAAYITGAFTAGLHHITTDRTVDFAGSDRLWSEYDAMGVGGQVELGYHSGPLTPFVALRANSLSSPAYSETVKSGSGSYALDYAAHTTSRLNSLIGVRAEMSALLGDNGTVTLFASAAWSHDYLNDPALEASFQMLPGSSFEVEGASAPADSLVVSAGADFAFASGLSLSGQLTGTLSESSYAYGGNARLGSTF
jgi:outer membrane autotransporter protein